MIRSDHIQFFGLLTILSGALQVLVGALGLLFATGAHSPPPLFWPLIALTVLRLAALAALRETNAAGASWPSTIGFLAVLAGQLGYTMGFVYILNGHLADEWNQNYTALGHMLTDLGMLVLGVTALRAAVTLVGMAVVVVLVLLPASRRAYAGSRFADG